MVAPATDVSSILSSLICSSIAHPNRSRAMFPEPVMLGKLDQAFLLNQTALSLRSQRQEVLASNIANADTPNYKARDIDFSSALNSALSRAGAPADSGALVATSSGTNNAGPGV